MATASAMDEVATISSTTPSSLPVGGAGNDDPCLYVQPPLTNVRFWIVTVFGAVVSTVGMLENAFLFYLFSTRRHHRHSYNMYMMFLAFFDFFVSGAYILLMSANVLADYLQSPAIVNMWFSYMVPILTISHIGITSSSFLILAATFERYCLTVGSRRVRFVQRNRKWIVLAAIGLGVLSKGTIAIEFKIIHQPECAGLFQEWQLKFADFVYGSPYHIVWRFWYRNFVTVFFPFLSLLALNISIVRVLTRTERLDRQPTNQPPLPQLHSKLSHQLDSNQLPTVRATLIKATTTVAFAANKDAHTTSRKKLRHQRKKIARSATRTTVLVVCTYLVSNVINVVLTTWEHVDQTSLVTDYIQFYAIAVDMASLLTNIACVFRPLIYPICQPAFRKEVSAMLSPITSTIAWICCCCCFGCTRAQGGGRSSGGRGEKEWGRGSKMKNPARLANDSTLVSEVILTSIIDHLTILAPHSPQPEVIREKLLSVRAASNREKKWNGYRKSGDMKSKTDDASLPGYSYRPSATPPKKALGTTYSSIDSYTPLPTIDGGSGENPQHYSTSSPTPSDPTKLLGATSTAEGEMTMGKEKEACGEFGKNGSSRPATTSHLHNTCEQITPFVATSVPVRGQVTIVRDGVAYVRRRSSVPAGATGSITTTSGANSSRSNSGKHKSLHATKSLARLFGGGGGGGSKGRTRTEENGDSTAAPHS